MAVGSICLVALLLNPPRACHADLLRKDLGAGVGAVVRHGRTLGMETEVPPTGKAKEFLSAYLADPGTWKTYQGRQRVFVPFSELNGVMQRRILLSVYTEDTVNAEGWTHVVVDGRETLWSLCEWLTGKGTHYREVMAKNGMKTTALHKGQRIVVPASLLTGVMKQTSRPSAPASARIKGEGLYNLKYASDRQGAYALYRLRKGETIYTSVVVRFSDYTENKDVLEACRVIAQRSSVRDVRDIEPGQKIYIPLYMLSERYLPKGSKGRETYEASLREAKRLKARQAKSKRDLSDVVIILDPGHGGSDPGAKAPGSGLYEDEINYDIVVRIMALLKAKTGATVYTTVVDRSRMFKVSDRKRFIHDQDEELTTHPPYLNNGDASISANLRWMLVNSIYDKEIKRGKDPRKIIFTSIHTDSIFDGRLRGAMIYIPGAKLRRREEIRTDAVYARYQEGRSFNRFSSSDSERIRDEALSRNFASVVLDELGKKRIKRHDQGNPIRSQIRRGPDRAFVPAVLRNTKVPTKILIETANLNNSTDRKRLADPWWRQQFAEAYLASLRRYFGSPVVTQTASAL